MSSDSIHIATNITPIHPLELKNVGSIVEVTEQDAQIKSLASGKLSSSEEAKPLDNAITSAESAFSDPQLETSDKVVEACDMFFQKEKLLKRETVDAAVERVFDAIMEVQNQSMENVETEQQEDIQEDDPHEVVQAEQSTPTEGSGEVSEAGEVSEENEMTPEMLRQEIKEGLENLSAENADHHLLVAGHEFHLSLINEKHGDHLIEIFQKVDQLGQGAFGKVSKFRNIDTGEEYALKEATPKKGYSLYEVEKYYKQIEELIETIQNEVVNATTDEEKIAAENDLKDTEAALAKTQIELDRSKAAEKDIKKEIKNLKFYNRNALKPILGVQPPPHKVSSNLGFRYMIEMGTDGDKLVKIRAAIPKELDPSGDKRIEINKKIVDSLSKGLDYMLLEKGMCHSDIKPGNILSKGEVIGDEFSIYHADFGADRPIHKIVNQLCDPKDETPIHELMTSTAAYTSSKIIDDIDILRNSIHLKVGEEKNDNDIDKDKEQMKKLIIQSCKFSLGLSLIELCIGGTPAVEAFDKGILFGNQSKDGPKGESYESDLQVTLELLTSYMPNEKEARTTILNLLGLGTTFELSGSFVALK